MLLWRETKVATIKVANITDKLKSVKLFNVSMVHAELKVSAAAL